MKYKSTPISLALIALAAVSLSAEVVDTSSMRLEFEDGWLTSWTNKKTGETVQFGCRDLAPNDDKAWVYQPGVWWHPSERPKKGETIASDWNMQLSTPQPDEVILTQNAHVNQGPAEAVQWSIQIPLNEIEAVHMPWGLAPARFITADYHTGNFDSPSYYWEKRTGILSFHEWRQRWYLIQGKTGGLLIYCDDPAFDSRQALEWDLSRKGFMTLTNRSMGCAPLSSDLTSSKWVIRQYEGWINEGAQLYQDFLAKTYDVTPLEQRPTAWVANLAFCINKPAAFRPPPYVGPGGVGSYNYNSDWTESLKASKEWLESLAKVVEPDKVMFYTTGWRQAGNDNNFPSNDIDPYFVYTCRMARQLGFHVMLHLHNHLVHDETVFYQRYIRDQSRLMGEGKLEENTADDIPYGVGYCALRDMPMIQRNKDFGSSHYRRMGLDTIMTGYHMHPGWEAYRYMKVANIVAAVQATGADMIHLDVPSLWHDKNDDRFEYNTAQGLRELYKLLRETFDAHGLANVAIATEVMPSEPILRYVDMAQMSRGRSAANLLEGSVPENLIELQMGKDLAQADQIRAAAAAAKKNFDPDFYAKVVSAMPELGQPSILAMANSPWVVGYPHLGNFNPDYGGRKGDPNAATQQNAIQALQIWWAFTNNTIPNTQSTIFADQPISNGRLALGCFWEKYDPRLAKPEEWHRGDIARYHLNNGGAFWVTRPEPLTLRLNLDNGKVLGELNVFKGWSNDSLLQSFYPAKEIEAARETEGYRIMEEITQESLKAAYNDARKKKPKGG